MGNNTSLLKSATPTPNRKVTYATLGSTLGSAIGLATGIIVTAFLIPELKHLGADIPDNERKSFEDAITAIFTVGATSVATFGFGYKARPALGDEVVELKPGEPKGF